MIKGVFVIMDGLGDLPHKLLEGKTPLEVAKTPNMDFLATRGEMGYMYSVKPGFVPQSDEAIVSIFGNKLISSTRGQLEARGTDIKITRGDLALRANFATVDSYEKGNILDRRAGRTLTTKEAEELSKAINKIDLPCRFYFESTVQHRGVLVLKGGFSDSISTNDLHYSKSSGRMANRVVFSKALDDDENSIYTANILNDFIKKTCEVLDKHPVNISRKKRGLLPANYLLLRGAGIDPPKVKRYSKWVSVAYMPLEIGFSKTSGMKVFSFDYPRLKKMDAYANLHDGLEKASKFSIKTIKKNLKKANYVYVHFKETDLPGHDNKPFEKIAMLEYLDKTFFKYLRKIAPPNRIKVLVTGDHSTPCKLKNHSADPVPVLFYPADENRIPKEKKFCEKDARKGVLGKILGKDLFKKVGFVK